MSIGDVAVRLARRTGDESLARQGLAYLDVALADPKFNLKDFHDLLAFARLTTHLHELRLLTSGRPARVKPLAEEQLRLFLKSNDDIDHNIRLAQILELCVSPSIVARFAVERSSWGEDRSLLGAIARTGDLDEDAQNYDSLGATFLVELALLLNHEDQLRARPNFRRMFERFCEIVSPSGIVPEYGDSYFSYTALLLDRVFLLEYAARLYADPQFRGAAQVLYTRPQTAPPPADLWVRGVELTRFQPARCVAPTPDRGTVFGHLSCSTWKRGESRRQADPANGPGVLATPW